MNQENIGKFMATLRKEKKLTQEQLAEKLGVNNRTVSRWENGHCLPDLSLLEEISKEFDVSVSEILNAKRMTREELIGLRDSINLLIDLDDTGKVKKADELNKTFIPEIEKGYEIYKITKEQNIEKDEFYYITVNKSKLNFILNVVAFYIFFKLYWGIFEIIDEQNSLVDIIVIFVFVFGFAPATMLIKKILLRLLEK